MKQLIAAVLLIQVFSCKAQIIALDDNTQELINGAYYKDVAGDMDKFIGTWQYSNGSTFLTIELRKVENYFNGRLYDDLLIGEYRYVENGVELINFLNRLDDLSLKPRQHYIDGNWILFPAQFPPCQDCALQEKRFRLEFTDPAEDRKHINSHLIIRYVNENGTEKIESRLIDYGTDVVPANAPTEPRVPYGEYTLIKQ